MLNCGSYWGNIPERERRQRIEQLRSMKEAKRQGAPVRHRTDSALVLLLPPADTEPEQIDAFLKKLI